MTVTIRRRELLAALGGAAAAWPLIIAAHMYSFYLIIFAESVATLEEQTSRRAAPARARTSGFPDQARFMHF